MSHSLSDRVYGCLIGGAVGDALGAPVEGWSYKRIRSEYGKVTDFEPYSIPFSEGDPGTVTDDSTLRHYISTAIVEHEGRITVNDYAAVLEKKLDQDRLWVPEEITLKKLLAGVEPTDIGEGNVPTATITSAITPVGVINADNPSQAFQDGYSLASVHQHGIEQGAAGTVAAGTAAALSENTTIDSVLDTMQAEAPDLIGRGLDLGLEMAAESDSIDNFVERFYDEILDWRWPPVEWNRDLYETGELFSGSSLEILPATAGILTFCGDDVERTLIEAASFGRDSDTIASIAGSLCGAVHGTSGMSDAWIQTVEGSNQDLFAADGGNFDRMANRLVDSLKSERDRASARAERLDRLLEE
jgi:ADP-ribosylglycohydrolase